MNGHEVIAQAFVAQGATDVFTLLGRGNMHWLMAMSKHANVRVLHARHEGAALGMAYGWASARATPGVCAVTTGPGLTQLATQLVAASRARTPLVVFAGHARGTNQDFDQTRFATSTECGHEAVVDADSAWTTVERAFFRATTEQRPIILTVPTNLRDPEWPVEEGRHEPSPFHVQPQRIVPDPDRIRECAQLLSRAERPVIIAGAGALACDIADELRDVAQRAGALLATTLPAKGLFLGDSFDAGIAGLLATDTSIELFQEADLVVGIGASLDQYTIQGGLLFPNAQFAHVDRRPPYPIGSGRIADTYVQADLVSAVAELDRLLPKGDRAGAGYRTAEVRSLLEDGQVDDHEFRLEPGTADPREIVSAIDEVLPQDVAVVAGSGHSFSFAAMHLDRRAFPWLFAHHFGAIGQGLPAAIGLSAALPSRPTVLFIGDGSLMMYASELDTAARYDLPLLVVVFNDRALGAEYHQLRASGYDGADALSDSLDIAAIASAHGCRSLQVTGPLEAKRGVQEFLNDPSPYVLDCRISRSVISIPYRRTHFATQFEDRQESV